MVLSIVLFSTEPGSAVPYLADPISLNHGQTCVEPIKSPGRASISISSSPTSSFLHLESSSSRFQISMDGRTDLLPQAHASMAAQIELPSISRSDLNSPLHLFFFLSIDADQADRSHSSSFNPEPRATQASPEHHGCRLASPSFKIRGGRTQLP